MSFNKAITHGKEHRKPWIGKNKSKNIDHTCRNHGTCEYCRSNRLYQYTKEKIKTDESLKDIKFIQLFLENDKKEDDAMSGINIRYCVDGFNNYAFDNIAEAAKYAKVADRCYFYNTTNTELYDCKNTWINNDDDDPIVTAVSDCTLIYIPDIETFNIIRENCAAPDLFPFDIDTFVSGWYFYNYLITTEDFNDDCFLPLKGNEELFAKQYNKDLIPSIYNIVTD